LLDYIQLSDINTMKDLALKEKAIQLRKDGYSYSLISQKLALPKATLSDWLSKVSYRPNQATLNRITNARQASVKAKNKQKSESLKLSGIEAKSDVGNITKRDLFMLGVGLYIGEGSKTADIVRISNSDPAIIRLAVRWFKTVCDAETQNFILRLHLYPDNNETLCIKFWSKATGIPTSQFQKTSIDRRSNKKTDRRGKLPYGTAHLSVRSGGKKELGVFLSRKINTWINLVLR